MGVLVVNLPGFTDPAIGVSTCTDVNRAPARSIPLFIWISYINIAYHQD
jgi:hypothetical protein